MEWLYDRILLAEISFSFVSEYELRLYVEYVAKHVLYQKYKNYIPQFGAPSTNIIIIAIA